jgi:hypothetical protein
MGTIRRWVQALASVAAIVLGAGCANGAGDTSAPTPITAPLITATIPPTEPSTTPGSEPHASVPLSTAVSCVASFSLETLALRSWAFSGTVTSVESVADSRLGDVPAATFDVDDWYRGGSQPDVTVELALGNESELAGPIEPGDRLLVSGEPRWGGEPLDDPVAWPCGFTRRWSVEDAATWGLAFGG